MDIRHIVAATDFSQISLQAIESALALAKETEATLHLVHVLEEPGIVEAVASLQIMNEGLEKVVMARLQRLVPSGYEPKVRTTVLHGKAAKEIADYAFRHSADMIVVGTHGRKGLAHLLLGSTAEGLLREAPCQVLVVKHKTSATETAQRGSPDTASPENQETA